MYSAGDQQRSETTNPGEIYNENSANDIRNRIQELLDLYYPSGIPADNTPPVILTLSAPDDDTETSVSANLVVGFTKAVVIGTGNITLKNLTDATQATIAVTDASQVSIAGSVLTINPTANLLASKAYAIRIDATAIHDTAGNSFAGIANDTTWNFTTQSANSGLFTWDGTNNSWTSAHWNAGAPLVSGPAGDNNHNFATINGGTVTFAASDTFGNAGAMSSPVITINSGGTLASGGFFNTMWDITLNGGTLLANGGVNDPSGAFALKGTVTIGGSVASNISVGAGTNNTVSLGISTGGFTTFNVADVTASTAPDLTISTVLNNNSNVASGLIKTGAGTLVLTGNNTYTGGTTLSGGILQIGAGSTSGALLSNTNITNNATLVFNRSDASSFSGSIGGSGTVTKQGAGTLTLSGNNTYTGTTTVSGGVLSLATGLIYSNLGFPDKQITINGGATVAVGGWGDAATAGLGQVSFSSYNIVVNNGTIQYTGGYENGNLDRGFTIGANGATLDAAGGANTFTLNQGRNFGIASNDSGTLTLTGSSNGVLNLNLGGAGALVKSGTGTWTLTGNDTYTGGTTVNGGTLTLQAAGQAGIIRGSLNINSGATVNVDTNWSLGYGGPLGPYGGAGLSVNAITINGGVLNFTGNFDSNAGTTASTITMTGGSISGSDFGWYQANTTTPLLQTLASSSRATVSAGIGLRLGGDSNNLTFNVASGTTSAGIDLLVSGAISRATAGDGTAGGGIIKTGGGTMVLSGANTYTGATTVSMGTLALVGGSQASPITVSGGASLGFTLGSPTTSTSSFNLTAGTIKITGTPTLASYTLITSSSGITGTPALAAPISGYQLQKVGNTLILVNPFASWAATPAFGLAPGNQGATANPDNDSVNNLLEYVLNGNPSIPDAAILPTLAVTATDFEFTYSRSDASLADTIQTFEYGSNLAGWTPVLIPAGPGVSTVGIATVTITDTGATDSVKISIPRSANAGGKLFGRLKVVK